MLHEKEMRAVYAETLIALMNDDLSVYCLEADLGKSSGTFPGVCSAHPDRFIQMGIAEANMIGVAAGLAVEGMKPFCASFSAFASRRCYDQITVSVAYSGLNVKIIGTAPGVTQAFNGGTHMCFQDLAIMRAMPGITVLSPADAYELRAMLRWMHAHEGPVYLQLMREKYAPIFDDSYSFTPGSSAVLSRGADVALITTGLTTQYAVEAVRTLAAEGFGVYHLHCGSVKPLDAEAVIAAARAAKSVITVENQNVIGGLGSAVCEVLAEAHPVRVKRVGIADVFGEVGPAAYLAQKHGIDATGIVASVKEMLQA